MADYIDAGKLNKAAQVLELRETAPGVWEWTPVRRAWASITVKSKTNLFAKVGIGARDAAVIVRRQPLTLHHALRWGDTHLFLTSITPMGRNHLEVAKCVAKFLVKKFGRKICNVVFSCIPASSPERNEMRNRHFSELVCKFSGAIDGFSHVSVIGERTAVHGTKIKKEERAKRINEQNNIEIDADFFKNKEVCIWDDVVTTGASFNAYVSQLEQAGAHVTNGIFLAKTSYKYVLK